MPPGAAERRRLRVTGTVQGVGLRPFVYRHATALGLAGSVGNDAAGVLVDVEGDPGAIAELRRRLLQAAPPLARVDGVVSETLPAAGASGFRIVASRAGGPVEVPVGADAATCDACLAEVDDPGDRRYRYPFTNCTDCGPRYTIVASVPYDRAATTMAAFTMCSRCQAEYDDPTDRRFHAQPNACPACGPTLMLRGSDGRVMASGDRALRAAARLLRGGGVAAVKGLGGYHLACDATDPAAVTTLRRRKRRDEKPFAVMVPDLGAAASLCHLDGPARILLASPARPIVLAPRRPGPRPPVADDVAPGLAELGLLLPYSALHHLLLADVGRPLVMTSGNVSDEPMVCDDADAVRRLGAIADAVLGHDRAIRIRCDDSVVRSSPRRAQVVRRSRGYSPSPQALDAAVAGRRRVLAVGAELKSTVSVLKGTSVVTSHHLGDLEHVAAFDAFLEATAHLCRLTGVDPDVVAHDLHPGYLSTKWARRATRGDGELAGVPTVGVQHHHAHVAACLAEHGRSGPVVGVAFDGAGYGPDGTVWGGEVLVADVAGFERAAHLRAVALPGGVAAIREPWRMALAWLWAAGGPEALDRFGPQLADGWQLVVRLLEAAPGPAAPTTTSAGRLFDAVAALLGVRSHASYEGQAAAELEALARSSMGGARRGRRRAGDATVGSPGGAGEGPAVLDPGPLVLAAAEGMRAGRDRAELAAAFHVGLAGAVAEMAARVASVRGLDTVALSGGVFQNATLTDLVVDGLSDAGLAVLVHERVPPNDGGISLGQAVVAANAPSQLAAGSEP